MSVIDASVAVKWFVAEPGHIEAIALLRSGHRLVAPDVVLLETANVLRRKHKRGELSEAQWREAVDAMPGCFDRLYPLEGLVKAAVDLAIELDHPVYDCLYFACALSVGMTLATADMNFARKVQTSRRSSLVEPIFPSAIR